MPKLVIKDLRLEFTKEDVFQFSCLACTLAISIGAMLRSISIMDEGPVIVSLLCTSIVVRIAVRVLYAKTYTVKVPRKKTKTDECLHVSRIHACIPLLVVNHVRHKNATT